ncbi:leucine-rich repeat domain-containing protein [uncultured Oscillibacter sp.]|uniref:leucine-rich repeat domain-containing protein n=1 Tax=uncultured Oscillibacter sp. TaxID=876091 RepID=UPI00345B9980
MAFEPVDGDLVLSVGANAFRNCSNLTEITLPDSLTTIGPYAFVNCTSLTNITLPDSVTRIENGAFYDGTNLTAITFTSNPPANDRQERIRKL